MGRREGLKRAFFPGILVLAVLVLASASQREADLRESGAALEGEIEAAQRVVASAKATSKVESFLQKVERAGSLDEVSRAFEEARFSQAELKELEARVKQAPYSTKLEDLKQRARPTVRPPSQIEARNAKLFFQQKKEALLKQQNERVLQLNRKLQASLPSLPAKGKMTTRSTNFQNVGRVPLPEPPSVAGKSQGTTTTTARSAELPPGAESIAQITDYTSAGTIGGRVEVKGRNFGGQTGQVSLHVENTTFPEAFLCPISIWTDQRIVFLIPRDQYLIQRVGPYVKRARIWIQPHGRRWEATALLYVKYDLQMYVVEIDRVTPETIGPGQSVIVEGNNFKPKERCPRFVFSYRDIRIEGQPRDCTDTMIVLEMPRYVEGIPETVMTLGITNELMEDENMAPLTRPINFRPAEDIVLIESPEGGDLYASCRPRDFFPLCLAGDIRQYTLHDWRLINGWTVDEAWIEEVGHFGSVGSYYERRPERGSALAKSVLDVWADAYAWIRAKEYLIIKGPRGVPYIYPDRYRQ